MAASKCNDSETLMREGAGHDGPRRRIASDVAKKFCALTSAAAKHRPSTQPAWQSAWQIQHRPQTLFPPKFQVLNRSAI